MNFIGLSTNQIKKFREHKIDLLSFRPSKNPYKLTEIPDWLITFQKIKKKDHKIDEQRKNKK